jgi:CRP/FNR family transcriptional regulator
MAEIVLRSRCFRGVDRNVLKDFLQSMELRPFQRNQPLWREGEPNSRLAIVAEGRIKLVKHRASGKDLIIDILGPGQVLGMSSSSDDGEPASAIGLAQGVLATIDRQLFFSRLRGNALIAVNLVLALAHDERTLMGRFDEVTAGSVEARLASLLYRLADEEGEETDEGTLLTLPLSRQDLADLVDTTIETAIRIMSRWNREKVVITQRNGFLIPDLEELEMRLE